jgi:hypothetical protein
MFNTLRCGEEDVKQTRPSCSSRIPRAEMRGARR